MEELAAERRAAEGAALLATCRRPPPPAPSHSTFVLSREPARPLRLPEAEVILKQLALEEELAKKKPVFEPAEVLMGTLNTGAKVPLLGLGMDGRTHVSHGWEINYFIMSAQLLPCACCLPLCCDPAIPGGRFSLSVVIDSGTWKAKPGEVKAAVQYALQHGGYRHIDCASVYEVRPSATLLSGVSTRIRPRTRTVCLQHNWADC